MIIKLKIGSTSISVDKCKKQMDVSPFIKNDRTFVPVRFIAEAFGYNVDWNEKDEVVTISNEKENNFNSIDEAALDWAMYYNNPSIGLHKEFSSSIYKTDKGYSYTIPNLGTSNKSIPSLPKEGINSIVGVVHSHASTGRGTQKADKLSSGDLDCAISYKVPIYAATPCGTLIKATPKQIGGDSKTYTIDDKIPYDRNAESLLLGSWKYPNIKYAKERFQKYHNIYIEIDTTIDYYNKLFAEGKSFPLLAD